MPRGATARVLETTADPGPRLGSAASQQSQQRPVINRGRKSAASRLPQIISFPRQHARHVRLTAGTEPVDVPSSFAIRTLSITDGSAPTVDLALRKDAKASSCAAGGDDNASTPSSAVDGNPCTGWTPAPGDHRAWIQLDLGRSVFFDQVRVVPPWQPSYAAASSSTTLRPRVSVSQDGEVWTEVATAGDDPFGALRADLGATLPPCPGTHCEPLHVQADPATWQLFAVNHTALRVVDATVTALVYDPFGTQLNEIEQRAVTIEPLSIAPCFVVAWPGYLPRTHLLLLRLHDADGALLSEHDCWRHPPITRH